MERFISLSFQGDRARFPFKLRGWPLVTISIVVAVLRKRRNAFDQHECVSPLFITLSTPPCERWTASFRKGPNIGNFGRLYIYNTMCRRRHESRRNGLFCGQNKPISRHWKTFVNTVLQRWTAVLRRRDRRKGTNDN
jgi:hypothetical protein